MGQCQRELRLAGKAYPRTCPTCGLSGACVKGLSAGVPDRNPMTPAQPALDAMMEGVTATSEEGKATDGAWNVYKGWRWHFMDADAVAAYGPWYRAEDYDALAAEVRAQRETIAGLTARVEALTRALRPFADYAELSGARAMPDDFAVSQGSRLAARQITMGDCRKARAALSGEAPND
jgi:hypothetical protein